MKLLFLAPQPFFQERGTPIAVRLALEVLAQRVQPDGLGNGPHQIDLVTYHEGQDVAIPHVQVHRIKAPCWVRGIGPGISCKKLFCDVIFLFTVLRLVWRARGKQYDLVHAVEESVFMAWLIKLLFGIPYIYDMDSSLVMQVSEKWVALRPFRLLLELLEKVVVKSSLAVVPVCDALAAIAQRHGSKDTIILRDVSLLKKGERALSAIDLRAEIGLAADAELVLYIGNLEPYQGIDLLVESFARAAKEHHTSNLIIIGGSAEHIARYREHVRSLGIAERVHLLGPRPLENLNDYIRQADILTSPRIKGNNTPMKVYSYLHSGRAVLATNLFTHTQVLTSEVAALASPTVEAFAAEMLTLLRDPTYREGLGAAGLSLAEANYTFEVFRARLDEMYDRLGSAITQEVTVKA